MTLEIYKLTLFFICFSLGILFVESSELIPGADTGYADRYVNMGIFGTLNNLVQSMIGNSLPESLSFLGLGLATFGLLVFTLGVMLAIFGFGYLLGTGFIDMLPLTTELNIGFKILLLIIYIVGYMQYKANISLKQF